ncbi:MAG: LPS export ABC transporter periplasmic protein LptC [Bacteroidales bacterium]|nr:LPS export ABC transporter periplasmic protein LptC [Bacteroidales bacterium]
MLLCALFISCSGDMNDISRFERKNLPDQEITNAHIRRSEQGRLQVEIDAPRIVRLSNPSESTVYPKGVDLRFYDEQRQLKTTIHARRAVSYDDRNIMKASDSVVVVDYSNGDTVYLEDLIWRDDEDIIFSNHPVRAVNGNRVTYGDGFVSDEQMSNLRITRQRGVIEFNDN